MRHFHYQGPGSKSTNRSAKNRLLSMHAVAVIESEIRTRYLREQEGLFDTERCGF